MSHDQILELINAKAPKGVRLNVLNSEVLSIGGLTFYISKNIFGRFYWTMMNLKIRIKRNSDVHKRLDELYFECLKNNL